ncbi:AAA domain-containing protein [Paraburkholderia sp. BL18I3N2]|uniref:ATP-binding protein n=1 Tax=unclassified Paraburkholderia TaxID=2615204 RepID=UPI000D0609F0|nr:MULTISPECIES: ATP-binding protein [unclassified Paraburkholderia]PRX24013.1 AAA domain-containing protein [Paraburkholderia sp. BL18I3N2]PRX95992.1 AAA domain-containing protein [Paraburkholderia sp. BL25I1N1]TDY15716.1 AAA domain-containing protein [Paraburkholderia sp. BL6665CI2N2]
MLLSTTRPLAPDAHPLLNRGYMVPTPSIGAMYMCILRCIRRGVSGAMIYGHTRWGKTYAIRYCERLLRDELPRVAIFHLGMPQNPSRSESLFFGMLLAAARHERPDSGSALQRRFRLYNRLTEIVERASGKSLVVFVDEAQRLELEHYEWLRDVQDEMERRGIRMYTFLVGQPSILNRKTSFRQSIDTSQIVSRFMIEEMRFQGFQSAADLEVSLSAYDESVFPEGSDWTFTRFFLQHAYDSGFRLGHQSELVWEAFGQAHRNARFDFTMELPMEYVARAVEIVLGDNLEHDAPGFALSPALWALAVEESDYAAALEDLRIVFVDSPAGP